MKIAIVHDWLVTYAEAERVEVQMLLCYLMQKLPSKHIVMKLKT